MDSTISRIDFLLKHINLVLDDIKGKTMEEFCSSDLQVRATCFSLTQIGEQMIRLEKDFKDVYPNLPWLEARDLRNLIVHVYHKVDGAQIYKTANEDIEPLKNNILLLKAEYCSKA